MASKILVCLLVLSCAVTLSHAWWSRCGIFPPVSMYGQCNTCNLFKPMTVTLRIRNVLVEPTFEESLTLQCTRYKTLFYIMKQAADRDSKFRFSATYYGSSLGFFVTAINNVGGSDGYWKVLDGSNQCSQVGVSSYKPQSGETITFNYTHTADYC